MNLAIFFAVAAPWVVGVVCIAAEIFTKWDQMRDPRWRKVYAIKLKCFYMMGGTDQIRGIKWEDSEAKKQYEAGL